jgi:Transglutaminase-like superfamily
LKLLTALSKLAALPAVRRKLLFQAFATLVRSRLAVWFLPLTRLRKGRTISDCTGATVQQIVWAVGVASRFVPSATCLVRAFAAQNLFARHGHTSDMVIGVAKGAAEPFAAHAWVEHEGSVILGGSATEYSRLLSWSAAE